jgi:hypothetical protein
MSAKETSITKELVSSEQIYTVPKEDVDDSLYIFHDTFFSLAKK